MPQNRTIIRTDRFEQVLLLLEPDIAIADEYLSGVDWILSRDPLAGYPADDTSTIYTINVGHESVVFDGFTIFYSFDDEHVWLLDITRLSPLEP
jgi:hypothetical protein